MSSSLVIASSRVQSALSVRYPELTNNEAEVLSAKVLELVADQIKRGGDFAFMYGNEDGSMDILFYYIDIIKNETDAGQGSGNG
jgi:hypothetical protein